MKPPRGTCNVCGEPVNADHPAAFAVTGIEIEREQGGANHILNRARVPNLIMHARCAKDPARWGQESLLR